MNQKSNAMIVLLILVTGLSGCATVKDLVACNPLADPTHDHYQKCMVLRQLERENPATWARSREIRAEREALVQEPVPAPQTRTEAFGQGFKQGAKEALADANRPMEEDNYRDYQAYLQAQREAGIK